MEFFSLFFVGLAIIALFAMVRGVYVIRQQECLIVERLGRFHAILSSGPQLILPFIDQPRQMLWIRNGIVVPVERIDLRARHDAEGDVHRRLVGCAAAEPEVGLRRFAKSRHIGMAGDRSRDLHHQHVADGLKRLFVERLAARHVAHDDTGVVNHFLSRVSQMRALRRPSYTI